MGRLATGALTMSAVAVVMAGGWGGSGCTAGKATELVPGVMTQVVVPRDLHSVRVDVLANGRSVFCVGYDVSNGTVELPATLGLVSPTSPNTVVTVEIRGYDTPGATGQDLQNCYQAPVGAPANYMPTGGPGPRMLRRSIQSFVDGHILFLPMPLSYSCFDVDCSAMGTGSTCKGAQCIADSHVDAHKLVDFDPAFINGTGVCFSPSTCFPAQATVTAVPVDLDNCIWGFPYTPPTTPPSPGLNVRVYYQDVTWSVAAGGQYTMSTTGGEAEILDEDPDEGFQLKTAGADGGSAGAGMSGGSASDAGPAPPPPPTQLFQLAPGLCKLAKAASAPPTLPTTAAPVTYRTISTIEVSNFCAPKVQLLPICKEEQPDGSSLVPGGAQGGTPDGTCNVAAPLQPTPSAIYVVMDSSVSMHGAFGSKGYATAMSLSFADPVFKRTVAAFDYLPGNPADCTSTTTTSFTNPAVDFGLASSIQSKIASQLQSWQPAEGAGSGTCSQNADGTPGTPCSGSGQICSATAGQTGTCYAPNALKGLYLQAAMRLDTGAYAHVLNYLQGKEPPGIAGAMFFVNRTPDSGATGNDCSPPLGGASVTTAQQAIEAQALAAFNSAPVSLQTYFVVLDSDQHDATAPAVPPNNPGGALTFFKKIQTDLPQAVTTLDATSKDPQTVLTNFSNTVTKLGTCLYELPKGLTSPSQATVKFSPPGVPEGVQQTVVPPAPSCNAATQTTVDGWNVDGQSLRICGKSCDQLRQLILVVTGQALSQNLSVPDVTPTVTLTCGAGTGSGGTTNSTRDAASMTGTDSGGIRDATSGTGDSSQSASDATADAPSDAAAGDDGGATTPDAANSSEGGASVDAGADGGAAADAGPG